VCVLLTFIFQDSQAFAEKEQARHESRERNAVERPDNTPNDPVTALRSVPGFHFVSKFSGESLTSDFAPPGRISLQFSLEQVKIGVS